MGTTSPTRARRSFASYGVPALHWSDGSEIIA